MCTIAYKEGGGGGGGVGGGKGDGEGSRLRTCTKKFFLHLKVSKRFFFGTKEAITLPYCHLLLCIENCKPALSYK